MRNYFIFTICIVLMTYSLPKAAVVNQANPNAIVTPKTTANSKTASTQADTLSTTKPAAKTNDPLASIPPVPPPPTTTQVKEEAAKAYAQGKYAKAHELWLSLAKLGDGAAMNSLGMLYDGGQGVPQDSKQALTWFRKSAEAGYAGGMSNLGRMLEQGRGTARHVDTAAAWFRKAADLGQADAQYNLGVLYERGEGVIKNHKHAASWYSLAAANQQVDAQARLGHLYRNGIGVDKNHERATLLLYGASMSGHAKARQELMDMAKEKYKDKLPQVTLFGADLSAAAGVGRAKMRSSLAVSNVKALREDMAYICDVYDLQNTVPGANQMAACYGTVAANPAEQPLGFLKIDYIVSDKKQADAIQDMVEKRFGPPAAGEDDNGALWNLGSVIVATQYVPESKQVGLMYMLPSVYHMTQQNNSTP